MNPPETEALMIELRSSGKAVITQEINRLIRARTLLWFLSIIISILKILLALSMNYRLTDWLTLMLPEEALLEIAITYPKTTRVAKRMLPSLIVLLKQLDPKFTQEAIYAAKILTLQEIE